jgi:lipopolysaccharide/colanic/teichoic acid biosynthesis glycosyltransferase
MFRPEDIWAALHAEYATQLAAHPGRQAGIPLLAKMAIDRAIAAIALLATAPLLGLAALGVAASMGRPVLFTQVRPGKRARPIRLFKLRTMSNAAGPDGALLPDAERLTRLGRLLRATSIDDLPNLFNVLKGDLSLVGPRPLLLKYLELYSPEQARRHDVVPGITGWAQIHGRNADTHEDKFALDVWYVDNWSLGLDLKILAKTLGIVLRHDGISGEGHATVAVWTGNQRTEHE